MYLGKVIGNVVSTRKNEKLRGLALLIVERLNEKNELDGTTEVAVDSLGAGNGDIVIIVKGSPARLVLEDSNKFAPVDTAIVGIVDQ